MLRNECFHSFYFATVLLVHFTKRCSMLLSRYLFTLFIRSAYVYFMPENNIYVFDGLHLDDSFLFTFHLFPFHLNISLLNTVSNVWVFLEDKHITYFWLICFSNWAFFMVQYQSLQLCEGITILRHIWKVQGSNLRSETDSLFFLSFSRQMGDTHKLHHNCFLYTPSNSY